MLPKSIYRWLRPLLFALPPETSHTFALKTLHALARVGALPHASYPRFYQPVHCFGLEFPNPVGLAAGLDKNGECIPAWRWMGFGFVEVGTVTWVPQKGNPKPRLFRFPKQEALINSMGFNNKGVEYMVSMLRKQKAGCPLGVNIGKNKETPLETAWQEYVACFEKVAPFADYVTVNLSSPNTPGLRDLQEEAALQAITVPMKEAQERFAEKQGRYVPLLVKIAPDLVRSALQSLVNVLLRLKIDGVIATNTTSQRPPSLLSSLTGGGLSGKPLFQKSTEVIRCISQEAGDALPIVASGGIMTAQDAIDKIQAGAQLVQLYTGFIYHGPQLIRDIITSWPSSPQKSAS